VSQAKDSVKAQDGASVGASAEVWDVIKYRTVWTCQKWNVDQCEFATRTMKRLGFESVVIRHGYGTKTVPITKDVIESHHLLEVVGSPEELIVVEGNLLLNEGLQRLRDLLVAAGGVAYNNANAFVGVGDSNTAEAATQTELSAASNRFYKAMNATFPTTATQAATWASDFTGSEANYAWQEWTVCAGATVASGAGFTSGTTNLNRKVQSLGTKAAGTWTLSATITFS